MHVVGNITDQVFRLFDQRWIDEIKRKLAIGGQSATEAKTLLNSLHQMSVLAGRRVRGADFVHSCGLSLSDIER